MKIHLPLFLPALLALPGLLYAVPVEIARESFEGTAGSIGFTTSVPQFIETSINPQSDYFSVIPNNGTKISGSRTLAGADGASIFAAEDCDTPRTSPATPGPQEVTLTTNPVNIAGKTNTQVRLLMAAPGRSDGVTVNLPEYENFSNAPLFINKLKVEASIDGGAFQRVVQFSPTVAETATTLSFDADGNNVGNDVNPIPTNPTVLDATLREGIYAIPTGNTVSIRLTVESDATGELICFDNIRIFGETSATAAPVLGGVPATALTFTEGGAAAAIAPAITVTDTDSANLASATVTISTGYVNGEDVLAATPSGSIVAGDIVFVPLTGRLTITRSATKANYETVLRSVTYRNTNTTAPSTALRRVTFQANDGVNASNSPLRDINVVDALVTQSLPFVESWETEGRGTRYAVEGGFSNPPDMFARFQPAGLVNIDGTFAWGVENVDNNPEPVELITFNLNASGLGNLTGELRVAAGGGAVYDTGDFLRVEASADGGPFQNVLAFYSEAAATSLMRQDTTPNDATNVGTGTVLTAALQNFTFSLPTATALTVRIRAHTNITGENITFDRLAVNGSLPPVIVTNASDNGPGSLRATVAAALAQAGPSLINFDPAVFNGEAADVITLSSGEIFISDAAGVTIDASGIAAGVAIDGGPGTNRLFRIDTGTAATLQALRLTGGNGTGGGAPANYGGAIHNSGTLTLTDCSISSCSAGTAGGAIFNVNSTQTLTLTRCTLSHNSAQHGGAIQNEGTLVATNSTFAHNTATQNGGAISSPFGRPASLTHCTVANNTATLLGGGGIGTAFSLANSIVAGNTPDNLNGSPALTGINLIAANPRLGPLMNNGGRTATLHPLPGSLARDRITTLSLTTDQRGIARPQWGATDIGAVEAGIEADCAWEVRDVWTSPVTSLLNLTNVDAMLANPLALQATGIVPTVNFNDLNGGQGFGHFTGDRVFVSDNQTPQGLSNLDDDSFATVARAYLTITTESDYTFGFATDDGARLRLYSTTGGANPVFISSTRLNASNPDNPAHNGNALTFNAPTGDSSTLGVAHLTPGVYGVELTMWEDFGGASGEVFFATGAQTVIAGNAAFALLGGNQLTRTPGIARPLNDDFAAAAPLSGAVVQVIGCNTGATIEAGEPSSNFRTQSVWFTWTAPATTGYQIDTIGSSYDTQLAIFTGSTLAGLAQVAFDDDGVTGTTQSRVTFGAAAGTVYRIQLSNYDNRPGSTFLLNIGPPGNQVPTFTVGPNQNVFTNAGPQSVPGWATAISPGAPWETTQSVSFIVSTTNPGLFIGPPSVSPDGTLSYVPAPTAGGTATVSVQIADNGFPPLTSAVQTFTITTSLAPTTGTALTINAGGTGAGSAAISQNFNTLSSASVPWVDNSTVPGWYAQINDGLTPGGTFQPSDGTTALTGLINCGSTGAPADRSLGSKATSTGNFANISYAVVIRNIGNLPVKLSRLRYAEELWRSGSVAGAPEKVTVFYAISDAPLASIASGPTAAIAAAGAGFTALPAGANTQVASGTINSALDGNLALNRSIVDFTPAAGELPAIFPGQYLTVKWTDTNEAAGTDGHQAVDDVVLDFTEVPCALYAVVNSIVRNYVDGPNDTVDVSFTVGGAGSGLSPLGWQVSAPGAFVNSGTYGVPKTITGLPLSAFTPTPVLAIRDISDPNCATTLALPLPLTWGYNFLSATTTYLQAGGNGAASPLFRQTAPNDLTFDPGSGVLTTDPVALTPGTEKCLLLQVFVVETSVNSGFEALDTLKVELLSTTPAGLEIETLTDDYDLNRDGFLSGGATPLADEFNLEQKPVAAAWTSPFLLVGTIPASATSVRLRISAVINGNVAGTSTEVYRFGLASLRQCLDTDGDGVTDFWESAHGTNNVVAASKLGLPSWSSTPALQSISLPTGNYQPRTYQLLSSPDMLTWNRDGLPVTGHLDPLGVSLLLFTRPPTPTRQFFRVLVQQPQQ